MDTYKADPSRLHQRFHVSSNMTPPGLYCRQALLHGAEADVSQTYCASLLVHAVPGQEQVVEAEGLADGLCFQAGIPSIMPAHSCVWVLPHEAGPDGRQQV